MNTFQDEASFSGSGVWERPAPRRPMSWLAAFSALAVSLILLAAAPGETKNRFQVVAHEDVPVDAIDAKVLAKAFLQKSVRWTDGTPIHPVSLTEGEIREAFAQEVLGKSEKELRRYWQRQIFTGRGSPPPERATDEEVLDYVARTPGAVGYVSNEATPQGVKVLALR